MVEMAHIGIVTGLASEAECLEAIDAERRPPVGVAGANAARARAAAEHLIGQGCAGLLSFGLAGGLDPTVEPGTAVLADAVVDPAGARLEADAGWRAALARLLEGRVLYRVGAVAGSAGSVDDVRAKHALHERTGALAVDMESHGVAQAAVAAGKPFLAVRVVADPAARAIPPWVLSAIDDDGSIRPAVIAGGLVMQPWAIKDLIGLARENGRAIATLRGVAAHAGPGFGFGFRA